MPPELPVLLVRVTLPYTLTFEIVAFAA